jgi:hypothetical protein
MRGLPSEFTMGIVRDPSRIRRRRAGDAQKGQDTLRLGTYLQEVRKEATSSPLPSAPPDDWPVSWRLEGSSLVAVSGGARRPLGAEDGFPLRRPTCLTVGAAGSVAVGGEDGLAVLRDGRWRYYASRRWLPDDRVTELVFSADDLWIMTAAGPTRLARRAMTLAEKAAYFEALIASRHNRRGYVTVCFHDRQSDSWRHEASDNDGLWTALYVAAESFRFAVTGEEQARRLARESLDALLDLERLTPNPGFPARAMVRRDEECVLSSGEWHDTADGSYRWKGDTSSDELDGHFFAYVVYHDLVADTRERALIREVVTRIADHLIDHGFLLVDIDGKPTRWGVYAPERLASPEWAGDRGLNSLSILSHLAVAEHITRSRRYRHAADELIQRHGYALNTIDQKITTPGHVNHSDDELAFLAYYPLLCCETNFDLRQLYLTSLRRSWQIERPERSPFFNFIYGALIGESCDAEAAVATLREIPLDLVHWTVTNSGRPDVPRHPDNGRFGEAQSAVVLPVGERPMMKWNGNPYRLDGGDDGRTEEDGTFFLLPYWMGRYHGLIIEE